MTYDKDFFAQFDPKPMSQFAAEWQQRAANAAANARECFDEWNSPQRFITLDHVVNAQADAANCATLAREYLFEFLANGD